MVRITTVAGTVRSSGSSGVVVIVDTPRPVAISRHR
jgi:hypothetical protein